MAKRRNVRRPRRVQVQFWRRGEAQAYPGYTTNISMSGMFVATNSPQPPTTRLRIEVLDGSHGFMVEGVVVHSRKIRGEMMRVSHPGMGVRFLSVEELVRELIPFMPGETEEVPETDRDWGGHGQPAQTKPVPQRPAETEPLPVAAPPARPGAPPEPAAPRSAPPPRAASPLPPPPASPPVRPPDPIPQPVEGAGAFKLEFLGPDDFLQVFHRDIVNGGLFLPTRFPGRLQEVVKIDLYPPIPGAAPISLRARIVQRSEPRGLDSGANLLSGMGVEILDPHSVIERLRPFVDRLHTA